MEKKDPKPYPTHISPALCDAYLNTTYEVVELGFSILVGKTNASLDNWLSDNNFESWAFITAWNPQSLEHSLNWNIQQNLKLESLLRQSGYVYFQAEGRGKDWSEKSLFVPDISTEAAISIAKLFKQYAILHGTRETTPRLLFIEY